MASRQSRYSAATRERAVRLYRQKIDGDERTDWQRLIGVAEKMGMTPETLRRWVREAEVEAGERPGAPSAAEVAELRRRNAELEVTVEILKAATSFFARECDPRPASSADSSPSTGTGSESHRSVER
jgi:transposase